MRLIRSETNSVILNQGRPILIVEARGRRVTWLKSASESESCSAFAMLSRLAGPSRRTLKIETIDARPALESPASDWLLEFGFVRDPPGLAFYLGW